MNLGKKGPSFSFGPKGLKYTIGPQGTRKSFGIPGTGIYYTTSKKRGQSTQSMNSSLSTSNQPNFFTRIFFNEEEKNFLEAMRLFSIGDKPGASRIFTMYSQGNDFSFMAGYLAFGNDDFF